MQRPIVIAVEVLGSQSALARAIGVSQQRVAYWLNQAKRGVPAEHVHAIEQATGGRVTAAQLRPDIFGKAPAETEAA